MVNQEISKRLVRDEADLHIIGDVTVREYVRFLLDTEGSEGGLSIYYEAFDFFHEQDGKKEGAVPDVYKERDGQPTGIDELTRSRKKLYYQSLESMPIWLGKTDVLLSETTGFIVQVPIVKEKDPKSRQRRVMQAMAPHIEFNVLYGDDLERLQEANPGYSFIPSKTIKEDSAA